MKKRGHGLQYNDYKEVVFNSMIKEVVCNSMIMRWSSIGLQSMCFQCESRAVYNRELHSLNMLASGNTFHGLLGALCEDSNSQEIHNSRSAG